MTSHTNQPLDPRDPHDLLGEESLLALVEGELSEARERQVLGALGARPELLALVRGMTRDKALLSDLCDVEAPAEVMESIDAALERAALLDSPGAFADLPPAPIAIARVRGERQLSRMLSMAAVVALLAGSVGFWALSRPGGSPGGSALPGPIALNTEKAPAEVASGESKASARSVAAPSEVAGPFALAKKDRDDVAPEPRPAQTTDTLLAMNDTPSEIGAAQPGEPGFVGPVLPEPRGPSAVASGVVTPELAVGLAAQGRLAVRVRARSLARTIDGLDALASRESDRSWRLGSRVGADDTAAGAAGAASGLTELAHKDELRDERAAFERSVAADSGMGLVRELEARTERRGTAGPSAYFASVSLTPESLESMRRALESEGDASVTFEELEGPAQPDLEIEDTDPLWWEEAPSRWVPWADVLVVVEE